MRRLLFVGVLAVAFVFVAEVAHAQVVSCRGKVKDENGEPLPGTAVLIEFQGGLSQRYETTTNKKGEFVQVGMRHGSYRITVTKDGYQGHYLDANIRLGDATNLGVFTLTSLEAAREAAHQESIGKIKDGFEAALELTKQEKWDEAEAAFKALAEQSPEIPELHYNLGFVAQKKQDWAAAEAAYQKALELRPDYGAAQMALAGVYRESGQGDKATEALAQVAADDQDDPAILFNLGVQYINNNQFPEAQGAFERCLAANPEMVEAHYHLGNVLVNQAKYAEAVANFEKYLSMNPDNAGNTAMAKQMIAALQQYVQPQQ